MGLWDWGTNLTQSKAKAECHHVYSRDEENDLWQQAEQTQTKKQNAAGIPELSLGASTTPGFFQDSEDEGGSVEDSNSKSVQLSNSG